MEANSSDSTGTGAIWLCGKPRFLREIVVQVLAEKFGKQRVHDAQELEPPALTMPADVRWLIWLVNTRHETLTEPPVLPPGVLNVLVIWNDGQALVQSADQSARQVPNLSLSQLTALVSGPSLVPAL